MPGYPEHCPVSPLQGSPDRQWSAPRTQRLPPAFRALGEEEEARKSFRSLAEFGEAHMHDKVGYDFFAVSMPELEVYQDDIQKRSDDYCRRLAELGHRGLRETEK